ncbi:MAG: GH3 auxin-responsive promoter family protein, partial [Bacteroidales bacterium]
MNTKTKLLSFAFLKRQREIERYQTDAEIIQQSQLFRLLESARNTEWGRQFDYRTIESYDQFASRVPLQTYEEIKPYVERMLRGEQN